MYKRQLSAVHSPGKSVVGRSSAELPEEIGDEAETTAGLLPQEEPRTQLGGRARAPDTKRITKALCASNTALPWMILPFLSCVVEQCSKPHHPPSLPHHRYGLPGLPQEPS